MGDGPDTVEHLGITDTTPVTTGFTGGDKRLLWAHLGPVHQALEQPRRQRGQGLQGAHVQDATLFPDFDGRMTNRHLAIPPGLGSGGRSGLETHVHFLHQGTLGSRCERSVAALGCGLVIIILACIGATVFKAPPPAMRRVSDRVMPGTVLQGHPTQLGEMLDGRLAAKAAVTTGLDPAKGHLRLIVHGRPVDVANARLDPLGQG